MNRYSKTETKTQRTNRWSPERRMRGISEEDQEVKTFNYKRECSE